MDAQAYLKKHGWRGTGHSLDAANSGLKKPLLVSKKIDVLGIGINKHDVVAGQWWMKAFDSSLKDFGTGKKSLLGNVKEHGVRRGGLYGRFVQGEGVPGTYGKEIVASTPLGAKEEEEEDEKEKKGGAGVDGGAVATAAAETTRKDGADSTKKSKKKRRAEDEDEQAEGKITKKKNKKQKKNDTAADDDDDDDNNSSRADKEARRAAKKAAKNKSSSETTSQASTPAPAAPSTTTDSDSKEAKRKAKKTSSSSSSSSKRTNKTLDTLPADKRKEYEDRAREKGISLEEYFIKRQAKNQAARKG